jgi:hypothetical protein
VIGVVVGDGDGSLFGGVDDGGLQRRDGLQRQENDRMLLIVDGKFFAIEKKMMLYPSRHFEVSQKECGAGLSKRHLSRLVSLSLWGPDRVLGVNIQTSADWRLSAPPLISLATGRALTPLALRACSSSADCAGRL